MSASTGIATLANGYSIISKNLTEVITKLKIKTAATKAAKIAEDAETGSVVKATIAQKAWNAAMNANPVILLVTALITLASVAGIVSKAIAAANQKLKEQNDKIIENANKTQEEIDANEKLYQTWFKIYDQYEHGKKTKEEMASATEELTELLGEERVTVAKLTGDYKTLNNEIRQAHLESAKSGLKSAQEEESAAKSNLMQAAYKGKGHAGAGENKYSLWTSGANIGHNEEKLAYDIITNTVDHDFISWGTTWSRGMTSEIDYKFEATEENIIKFYDQLVAARQKMNEEMTATDRKDSGLYQDIDSWINKMQEEVEAYKSAVADVSKYQAEIHTLEIDFSKDTTFDKFIKNREMLIKFLKEQEEYKQRSNETDEEWNKRISNAANSYISNAGGEQSEEYLTKIYGIDYLKDVFKDSKKVFGEQIYALIKDLSTDEVKTLLTMEIDKDSSLANLRDYITRAKKIAEVETITTKIGYTEDSINNLLQGKDLTEKQIENLKLLEKEYPQLQAIQDRQSQEYLEMLIDIREELEKQKTAAQKAILANQIEEITIKGNTDDLTNKLRDIAQQDYSILVDVRADIQSDFDNITTMMSQMETAASKIGEDFIVAAEDLEELGSAFPGILDSMKLLDDGSAQLNKNSVEYAMAAAQDQVKIDQEKTVQILKDQMTELESKRDAAQEMANIAAQIVSGEKTASEMQGDIDNALNTLKQDNSEQTANYEKDNDEDVAKTSQINASAMASNFAEAYKKMAADSAEWARVAAANMKVATTGQGTASSGNFKTQWQASYSGGTVANAERGELKSSQDISSVVNWEEVQQYYQNLASSYDKTINNTQAKIAEILARNNKFNVLTNGIAKGVGTGKNSNNDPNQMDYLDNEIDRYHKVNTQITKVDNSLKKLQSQQEKFVGSKLLDNLNKQWSLLNNQIDNYSEKLRIANEEEAELAAQLSGKGVQFNADGTIVNYAESIRAQEAYINSLIANYNSMSKEAQETYKDTVEAAKEDFEKFKTNLDRYDELVSDFIPQLYQNVQDALDKQIEINIQKFNYEITITLDLNQATRDWNAWAKRAMDGIDPEDILGNARARFKDIYSYFNGNGFGDIQEGSGHVRGILDNLYAMDRGEDNVYGNNRAKGLEELKNYYTQLMESITGVIELQDELYQAVLDEMDDVQSKFDKQVESYEYLREILNHDLKVIQLTLGEDAYGEMMKFYEMQQDNYQKQLDFQRQQKDFWYAEMQAAEEGSKQWESAREKWQTAVNEFNSILEEGLDNAAQKFENAINNIFKNLNNQVTNGMGLDYVNTQWDLINQNADRYLDTINASYGIRALEKKFVDSINSANTVSVQQRLKKLMDEQLSNLRERERITQYDIDRANKLYEIELARIALEEAQRNKSQMRLRRDSQGNYTYQYVADKDAIGEAEDQLSMLYNDLYNFDKERYNGVLNDIYSIWDSYQQAMAEAALINDPQKRAEKELLIQEQYNELMTQAAEDYEVSKFNLEESFFWDWADLNDQRIDAFRNMTETEKDLMLTEMIPTWKNGITEMADLFVGENGFANQTIGAWNNIKDAENTYAKDMEKLETISGQTFEAIVNGEDDSIEKAEQLIKDNEELIKKYGEELQAVKDLYAELEKVLKIRQQEYQVAKNTADEAQKYWAKQQEIAAAEAKKQEQTANSTKSAEDIANAKANSTSANASSAASAGTAGGDGVPTIGETVTYTGGLYYSSSYGDGPSGNRGPGKKVKITAIANGRAYPIHVMSSDSAYGWLKLDQLRGYDTGGYTGDWDNSGRLALLHQKELVLNAKDTENMLNTVAIMRSLAYSLGTDMLARMAGASAQGYSNGGSGSTPLEQNVHIDAQFPNVRNAAEIEEALNNLVNAASQRIMESR